MANPAGMVFGPDASGDGRPDLYVANSALKDGLVPIAGTSGVLRYDAASGAFLGAFVAPGNGLKFATFLTFTETDPSTLNYNGGNARSRPDARPGSRPRRVSAAVRCGRYWRKPSAGGISRG